MPHDEYGTGQRKTEVWKDKMKLIFIDVETTGLGFPESGLVQLAGLVEIDGEVKASFDYRIRPFPQDVITDQALALNRITRDELAQYDEPGIVFKEFVELLSTFVDRYDRSDKLHLVAYNAQFDAEHLRAWFEKNGDQYFGSWFFHPPLDVMGMAAAVLMPRRHTLDNFKLITVAQALGMAIDEGRIHDATYDVHLTKEVFRLLHRQINHL